MKTAIIALFMFLCISNTFADEIRLLNGTVIKGKILRVTPKYIEYDPEGARAFDMLPKDQVAVIIYKDGTVIKIKND